MASRPNTECTSFYHITRIATSTGVGNVTLGRKTLLNNKLRRQDGEETLVAVSLWRACRLPTAKWPRSLGSRLFGCKILTDIGLWPSPRSTAKLPSERPGK